MKLIYKDKAGNKAYEQKTKKGINYYAKNTKGELINRSGSRALLKEAGINLKGMKAIHK